MKRIIRHFLVLLPTLLLLRSTVLAQGSAFTYQGRLSDGSNPANGTYDLVFVIYEAPTGPGIFANLFNYSTPVTNGLFTVTLDFGTGMFSGADRWLEIGVRTNGGSTFTMMSPRQKFTATPYAITASNLTGVVPSAGLAGTYSGAVTLNNPANSYSGNGGGLTNVNAFTLGGLTSSDLWRVGGNNASPQAFLGTTNNQALELRVNNARGLRIEPTGGAPTLVGGYFQNYASGPGAVVAGGGTSGSINEAAGMYAFVGAGHGSKAGPFSVVAGGAYNVSLSQFSFIGSGLVNTNQGPGSVIVGGTNNFIAALADTAFIGGGHNNVVNNSHGTIGGGEANVASTFSTVGGGRANHSEAAYCTVSGGRENQSEGTYASVGGGYHNLSSGNHGTVAGGFSNLSASTDATVGGGSNNVIYASSDGSTISGGQINLIQADSIFATIAGGQQNSIGPNAGAATIAGGLVNTIEAGAGSSSIAGGNGNSVEMGATYSAIGGGNGNSVEMGATYSAIGGGLNNTTSDSCGTIGGGAGNVINSWFSTIAGGEANFSDGFLAGHATVGGGYLNTSGGGYATVGGGSENTSGGGYATVGGGSENTSGGTWATVGGGFHNESSAKAATVGGGRGNISGGEGATVCGGGWDTVLTFGNVARGPGSVIGGGIANTTLGLDSSVGGGRDNHATNDYAMVPGGAFNTAGGRFSFASGHQAQAIHDGAFVWADSQPAFFASTANDQFCIRAAGGVRLNTNTSLFFGNTGKSILWWDQGGAIELGDSTASTKTPYIDFHYGVGTDQDFNVRIANDGNGQLTIGRAGSAIALAQFSPAGLTVNGAVVLTSDRNRKENFQPVDAGDVLAKVAALPLTKWNYKEDKGSTHIGPMAQDFYAAFGVGPDDKHIATVDADGVALAAIQGLNEKVETRSQTAVLRIQKLEAENAELKQALNNLNELVQALNQKLNGGSK